MDVLRKVSIGRDYKDNAMHYAVGQPAYNGNVIHKIIDEEDGGVTIWIKRLDIVKRWKSFNGNMAIGREYDLDFEGEELT